MARRRFTTHGAHEHLTDLNSQILAYAEAVGDHRTAKLCRAELAGIRSGRPIVVEHGFEIGLAPQSGPWRLERDGTVRPCTRTRTRTEITA